MKGHIGWQNYVISGILTFGILIGIFQLKLALGHSISISAETVCIGSIGAIMVGVVLLLIKKPAILSALSMIILVAWVIIRGDISISSIILAGGSVGLIISIPFTAAILSRTPKSFKRNMP